MERACVLRQSLLSALIILFTSSSVCSYAESRIAAPPAVNKTVSVDAANSVEQDKVRKEKLMPKVQGMSSKKQSFAYSEINFPQENPCYEIDTVSYVTDNKNLKLDSLHAFTDQAQGKCLGIEGIRVLAKVLQNEVIRLGYITTRIAMPDQNLNNRTLRFDINAGNVGKIILQEGSGHYISLKNTLPLREGELLSLSDLEQGSFNLQRVPGSAVKINLIPGSEKGESDIYIQREQDKYWQVGTWLNDAGSEATGRYQGGAALYLNNLTSLSDTLYFSYGHDITTKNKIEGNSNKSVGYSVPWGYWWLDLYASHSDYQQFVEGNWASWTLNNKNTYYSAQLNRLLARTAAQTTSVGLQIFNSDSRYFLNDFHMISMHKKNAGWKAMLQHQRNYNNAALAATLSYQKKMPWFNSSHTLEQQQALIDRDGRIIALDVEASMNFRLYDRWLNYSPRISMQYSPDRLSSLNRFAVGNRWTVRGFDGEASLQDNKGWYWRNDLSWVIPERNVQPYIGVDIGQVYGNNNKHTYSGNTVAGSVAGLRGKLWQTSYDLFAGTPLKKPDGFHTDPLTLGFSLQWKY